MVSQTSRLPRALYQAAQVRELDRIAIQDCGIEGFALMQRAATAAFETLQEQWPQARHLLIFTGAGNNGGDGYVIAGLARLSGLNPEIIAVGDPDRLQGDAQRARQFAEQKGVHVNPFKSSNFLDSGGYPADHTIIVDALLGTGLDRPVSGIYAEAIDTINELPFPVLAVDIPSGLGADTGMVLGVAVQASLTITFIGMKQGLLTGDGVDVSGRLVFSNLDVPDQVYHSPRSPGPSSLRIDMPQASRSLQPRQRSANKGHFGHTVVVGGDYGFGGATLMAARAALRVGSGLVSVVTRSVNRSGLLASQPEIMMLGTEDPEQNEGRVAGLLERAAVIVVGPGLGQSDWSREMLRLVLRVQELRNTPLVVDADGLNLLAAGLTTNEFGDAEGNDGSSHSRVNLSRSNWVLTPHPGEAARLLDCETVDVTANRFQAVRNLQRRWGGVTLLKGAGSLICATDDPHTAIQLCDEGNPGMATGGMGDILSGLVGGLVAQGFSLADSLRIGVCLHGEAADQAAARRGQRGMAATDLLDQVQELVNPRR